MRAASSRRRPNRRRHVARVSSSSGGYLSSSSSSSSSGKKIIILSFPFCFGETKRRRDLFDFLSLSLSKIVLLSGFLQRWSSSSLAVVVVVYVVVVVRVPTSFNPLNNSKEREERDQTISKFFLKVHSV